VNSVYLVTMVNPEEAHLKTVSHVLVHFLYLQIILQQIAIWNLSLVTMTTMYVRDVGQATLEVAVKGK